MIDSFAQARQINEHLHLWIAGEGPLRDVLKGQVSGLKLDSDVTFLGYVGSNDLARYYTLCDLFVLPSFMETLSLVAIEAMSFGLPLIVTDRISCAKELVQDGVNGFIVSSGSVSDLSDKIMLIAQDPARRAQMGAAALEQSKRYDLDTVVNQIETVYHQVLQERA